MFAVAKLGAVMVPLNPRLTADDLRYTLRHSEATVAITAETVGDLDFLQLFEDLLVQLPELQYLITVGEEDLWYDDRVFQFEDLLSAGGGGITLRTHRPWLTTFSPSSTPPERLGSPEA
jgi:acyl-CoA synthetase (AMP-forming)/AMP-acid ligase II